MASTSTPVPPAPIVVTGSRRQAPRSAFHRRLQQAIDGLGDIAAEIGRIGQPSGEVIAFFMCAFTPAGTLAPTRGSPEAAWVRAANESLTRVAGIAEMNAEAFRVAMARARPTVKTPLMGRIDDHALLAIHAVASQVQAAIE